MAEPPDQQGVPDHGSIRFATAIRAFIVDYYRRLAHGGTPSRNRNDHPDADADGVGTDRPGDRDHRS